MEKTTQSYVGMEYDEISRTWTGRHLGSGYKPHELAQIDRKWRSLGRKAAHGAAVRMGPRKER